TSALASLFARVIALDLDATLLDQARSRTAVLIPPDRVAFLQANAYDLTHIAATHGGPADCVLLANTFHGVPDQARLARAAAATLRPGGSFVIINWHRLPREETKVLGVPRGPATGMDDTGGNRCRDRPGGFYAGAAGRPAALALCLRGNGRPATAARRPHL